MSKTPKWSNAIAVVCVLGLVVAMAARAGGRRADPSSIVSPRGSVNIVGDQLVY
jgi:hypothetical protein